MKTKTKYILTIVILIIILSLFFLRAHKTGVVVHEQAKSMAYSAMGFIAELPKAQLFFYAMVITIVTFIYLYHAFKRKYGLPGSAFQFIKNRPHDGRAVFEYKDGKKMTDYIPGSKLDISKYDQISYGFWIYISGVDNNVLDKDITTCGRSWVTCNYKKWKHVLHWGKKPDKNGHVDYQIPGIWLAPRENNLVCIFNTDGSRYGEMITLDNIDLNKWVHITLTLGNRNVTLYKNGKIEKSMILRGNPIISKEDNLYIGNIHQDGFAGLMYLGFYSNNELEPRQINSIYNKQRNKIKDYYNKKMRTQIYGKK